MSRWSVSSKARSMVRTLFILKERKRYTRSSSYIYKVTWTLVDTIVVSNFYALNSILL